MASNDIQTFSIVVANNIVYWVQLTSIEYQEELALLVEGKYRIFYAAATN